MSLYVVPISSVPYPGTSARKPLLIEGPTGKPPIRIYFEPRTHAWRIRFRKGVERRFAWKTKGVKKTVDVKNVWGEVTRSVKKYIKENE